MQVLELLTKFVLFLLIALNNTTTLLAELWNLEGHFLITYPRRPVVFDRRQASGSIADLTSNFAHIETPLLSRIFLNKLDISQCVVSIHMVIFLSDIIRFHLLLHEVF